MKHLLWPCLCWILIAALPSAASAALRYLDLQDNDGNQMDASYYSWYVNQIDTVAGTISYTIAYSDTIDLKNLHISYARTSDNLVEPILLDAAGDTLVDTSTIVLDAKLQAKITVIAEDGTKRAYTISVIRRPISSITTLSSLSLKDNNWNTLSAYSFSLTDNRIDTVAATITYTIAYSDTIDLKSLRISYARTSDNLVEPILLDAAGDTLADTSTIVLDARQQAKITVIAEDGTRQAYTISVTRRPVSSSTALASLWLFGNNGNLFAGSQIDTLAGTVSFSIPFKESRNLDSVRVALLKTSDSLTIALDDAGDTLVDGSDIGNINDCATIALDSKLQAKITLIAEDGTKQAYTITVAPLPPNSSTALSSLSLRDNNGDTLRAYSGNANLNPIDTVAGTIAYTVAYSDDINLDSLYIYDADLSDYEFPILLDPAGDTLVKGSRLTLDANRQAKITVVAEDGTKQIYKVTAVRRPISSVTALSYFFLEDNYENMVEAFSFDLSGHLIDTEAGTITFNTALGGHLNPDSLFLYYAGSSERFVEPILLSAAGDTLVEGSRIALDANRQAKITVIAEDGTRQVYTLSFKNIPISSAIALASLSLEDNKGNALVADVSGSSSNLINAKTGTISYHIAYGSSIDLSRLRIYDVTFDSDLDCPILLDAAGDTLAYGSLLTLDSNRQAKITLIAEDGTRQEYTLSFTVEINTPVAPDLVGAQPAKDWHEALRSSHGEARLYALNGRLLWSAPLPQSLAVLEDRRRAYTGPLMLRAGGSFYRLPPLPR